MRFSVALCTYNGERFLAEQLVSIAEQTRRPDELVVCDDASSDRSTVIVREFAQRMPFPVRIEVNAQNLGSTRNFDRAIGLCTGDVIILADQDDVWFRHKLAILETTLVVNGEAGFVFSNAEMVDERLSPLGQTLWDEIRFRSSEQVRCCRGKAFEVLLRRHRVTGATMAFRAAYRDLILPIPPDWFHDAWIALLISGVAQCSLVPQSLIRYRQHDGQQLGGKKPGLYGQYLMAKGMNRSEHEATVRQYEVARERLVTVTGGLRSRLALLDAKLDHLRQRVEMRTPGRWRIPMVLQEAWRGNYRRYSHGWKAMAQDLLFR